MAKRKEEGINGRVAKFISFIAYSWGFTRSHHYTRSIDDGTFEAFIQEHFSSMLKNSPNPKGKIFLQDDDLSQKNVSEKEAIKLH